MTPGSAFDPYNRRCPSRTLLDTLASRWAVLIVASLGDGPLRFSELRERIGGLSQKMLSQTLRDLRRDGLVRRDAAQAGPRRVEYALTPLGATLAPVMDDLVAWARTNAAAVLTYQSDHPDVTDQEKP
ncbi:helix-turn-helix domain-containing protein [Nigerium sp.]|uniref:winged helix-turn-helix transcriptional regulator n=1 Tax=Nigerium sp. TaxID=2042655 RepID=UPI0032220195